MAMIAMWHKVDQDCVVQVMREAAETLHSADREVFFDFASVCRLDPKGLRAMEDFAAMAQNEGLKIVLRGVQIDVYKVFKLMKLARRFSFVN